MHWLAFVVVLAIGLLGVAVATSVRSPAMGSADPVPSDDGPTIEAAPPEDLAERSEHISRGDGDGREALADAPVHVTVSLHGQELTTTTRALTVRQLLTNLNVVLADGYAVSHDLDAPVVADMRVVVAQVEQKSVVEEAELPYETSEVEDPSLPAGQRVVRTAGQPGLAVTTYLVTYVDGYETGRTEVLSVQSAEPQDEVVRVGTAQPVNTPRPATGSAAAGQSGSGSTGSGSTGSGTTGGGASTGSGTGNTGSSAGSGSGSESSTGTGGGGEATTPPATETPAPAPTQPPSNSTPAGTTPAAAKALAKTMAANRGWGDSEYSCLVSLWQKESGWNYQAANPSSTARGIPQAMMSIHFGAGWRDSAAAREYLSTPSVQIAWGLTYISGRHGTPCAAWSHSQAKGWY